MYDGPIREGSRGGRDQFTWEAVKGDKDREFYLGHSVKALVGQWQKNKDPYWYTRTKNKWESGLAEEVKAVREKEEELMLEALGMKAATEKPANRLRMRLQKYEVDGMLKRREKDDGDQEDEDVGMRGLGFRRTAMTMTASTTHEVMKGVGISNIPDKHNSIHRLSLPDDGTIIKKSEKKRKKDKKEKKRKKRRSRSPSPDHQTVRPSVVRDRDLRSRDDRQRDRSPDRLTVRDSAVRGRDFRSHIEGYRRRDHCRRQSRHEWHR